MGLEVVGLLVAMLVGFVLLVAITAASQTNAKRIDGQACKSGAGANRLPPRPVAGRWQDDPRSCGLLRLPSVRQPVAAGL
jgi:hypothetical protein